MMAALFSGVTGLTNNLTKMNVIGNNIANVNTIGFKGGRVTFREALVQTFRAAGRPSAISGGTNPIQVGLGMRVSTIDTLFQQGGLETTGQVTDLAIQGSGFFVLSDGSGTFYTRAGGFSFDANSALVDPATGMFVQGKMADENGDIPSSATVGAIVMPFGQQDPARATTTVQLGNNLNSMATTAEATRVTVSTTGITNVSGEAINGAGGTHNLVIAGSQATRATWTGANVGNDGTPDIANGGLNGNLTVNMRLTDLGITVFDDFEVTIDGSFKTSLGELNNTSTVSDLLNSLNQISGLEAALVGGEIQLTRSKAGNDPSIELSNSSLTLNANGAAIAGNIAGVIFGIPDGSNQVIQGIGFNGNDHTFVCTDTFMPNVTSGTPTTTTLEVVVDETTGLADEIDGLGGGGVSISTQEMGLHAGTAQIITEDTEHTANISIYDSQGGIHSLLINFTKSARPNMWYWQASFTGTEIITAGGDGTVEFNTDGSLMEFQYTGATALSFNPNTGAAPMTISIDAGTTGHFDGITGFADTGDQNTAALIHQDGHSLGILDKISIDKGGNIIGNFTNGLSRTLAQLILVDFNNQAGLLKAGGSLYQASANSGPAIEGVAGETIAATISSGALEASSVDIAAEFTNMISAQRSFQANARVISTSDQLLDELVNIKR
ncbi:MAG: flagellar hook-basal body complex protein [Candidatus Zixiibacteriota bacterium]